MNDISAQGALQQIPSVDEILQDRLIVSLRKEAGEQRAATLAREAIEQIRGEVLRGETTGVANRAENVARIVALAAEAWHAENGKRTRRVINATGVIIHTNLGRAPLSAAAIDALANEAAGYATVEYDLEAGRRGRRGERSERLLCQLTGAEAAIVVNNCAAAALIILSVFARNREVVISRGELVEIGGDFRVPDVLAQSGAVLREVGTTNRTKIGDYAAAVNADTAMLLRIHPSNYRITGFTETPALSALAKLAAERSLILYEDAGSGALTDLADQGMGDEPVIAVSLAAGADVVSFSGDKLLGGPQAGLIVGRRDLIEKLRKSPLYRALRVSKLTYAALEATLAAYACGTAETDVPVQRMLRAAAGELETRCRSLAETIRNVAAPKNIDIDVDVVDGLSVVGGGAAPDVHPPTALVTLMPIAVSAAYLERKLRLASPPVIARLQNNAVVIDLRTVGENDEADLGAALTAAIDACRKS